MARFPIIKAVRCDECLKFKDWGDGEMMCSDPKRKATVELGFDFTKPHICKYFVKNAQGEKVVD